MTFEFGDDGVHNGLRRAILSDTEIPLITVDRSVARQAAAGMWTLGERLIEALSIVKQS